MGCGGTPGRPSRSLSIGLAIFLLAATLLVGPSSVLAGSGRGAAVLRDSAYAAIPPDRHGWTNVTAVTREPSPALESYSTAVVDGTSETAMVFGGLGARGNVSATTWIYDDGNWEDITPVINGSSPPPLYDVNLAFDASEGYLLLFGGRTASGSPSNGTWAWSYEGYHWTELHPATSPPAESGGAMAYDPSSGAVVLLVPGSGQTWLWRSGDWAAESLSPTPSVRTGAVMVTDTNGSDLLLFGGAPSGGGPQLNDTWTFAQDRWTELAGAGAPPPFRNASATDDPFLGGVFLVGSVAGGATETWSFSSLGWREYAPSPSDPPPRLGATLAFDSSGTSILCGGVDPDTGLLRYDCWTWGVAYIPPSPGGNAPPLTEEVEGVAVVVVVVPLAIAIYLSTRPRRPDVSRVPVPASSGEPNV
jgi:hypothetical protein